METRFIKETEMFFLQFRGQRRPIGVFHGGTFLTAFKMRSIWCILFLNRIGPSQDSRHSPQKIQEVVPRFRSWKLSPPKLAMIWRGVRCRREYHHNDRLEKAVKKVAPWKIPIGRLCPRNCQKQTLLLWHIRATEKSIICVTIPIV